MMLSNKELLEKWNGIPFYGGGYKRIDDTHPLEWYIGHEDIAQKTILLITNNDPGNIHSSKSIIAATGQRQDGKWAVTFRLIKKENEDVFIYLCWDMIESSRDRLPGEATVNYIIERYNKWLKLMEQQRVGTMDESLRKGLIGELLFLQDNISKSMALQTAVNGWMGPEGADQDFIYEDGWTEIKCVGLSSDSVSISSLEQLDGELPGALRIYFLDKTSSEDTSAFTLLEKVEQLRRCFESDVKAKELFESKLFMYGYVDRKEYNEQKYRCNRVTQYRVDHDFPRLTKANVPSQIVSVKYNVSLASIESWKLE